MEPDLVDEAVGVGVQHVHGPVVELRTVGPLGGDATSVAGHVATGDLLPDDAVPPKHELAIAPNRGAAVLLLNDRLRTSTSSSMASRMASVMSSTRARSRSSAG